MGSVDLIPMHVGHVDAVLRIIRDSEQDDHIPLVTTRTEVEEWIGDERFEPSADGRLALVDGQPAGWCRVSHRYSGRQLERAFLFGDVDPRYRRRGIGSAMLTWQIGRATELLSAYEHDLPRFIRTNVYDWCTDRVALYERHGMRPIRWFEELIRPMGDHPAAPRPEGVEIVTWDRDLDEAVRRVKNAAFADHWGSTATSEDEWQQWLDGHGSRMDLSLIALVEGEPVGFSINQHYPDDEDLLGRRDGWIGSLGVVREWRGRGVASALIVESLERFASAGFSHAMLGVDSANPSGAVGLYRRLGFEPLYRSVTHEIEVFGDAGGSVSKA